MRRDYCSIANFQTKISVMFHRIGIFHIVSEFLFSHAMISFGTINNVLWNTRAMQNPGWETAALRMLQCL